MADHRNRHQTPLFLYLTKMQQGITRTALMEETLAISVTRSQRMSLLNLPVSFAVCHLRRSGIGESERTAFQQLELHERKKICRVQTLRKHQTAIATSILPKTWLSLTTRVKFTRGTITRSTWASTLAKLRDVNKIEGVREICTVQERLTCDQIEAFLSCRVHRGAQILREIGPYKAKIYNLLYLVCYHDHIVYFHNRIFIFN